MKINKNELFCQSHRLSFLEHSIVTSLPFLRIINSDLAEPWPNITSSSLDFMSMVLLNCCWLADFIIFLPCGIQDYIKVFSVILDDTQVLNGTYFVFETRYTNIQHFQ